MWCKVLEAIKVAVEPLILQADERFKVIVSSTHLCSILPNLPLTENIYWCLWAWIICPVVFITTGWNTLNLTHNAIWRWSRSLAEVDGISARPKHQTLQSFSIGEHGRLRAWSPTMSLHDHITGRWIREWRLHCVRVLSLERWKCKNGLYPLHVWSVRSDRGIRSIGLECLTKQQEESATRRGRWLLEHTHTEAKMTTGEEDGLEAWLWCASTNTRPRTCSWSELN